MDEAADRYTAFRDKHGTFDLGTEGSLSFNTSVQLKSQLFTLEQKRREQAALYTEAHPAMQVLDRSEAHTSELQSLMRISYAVFCLKKKTHNSTVTTLLTQL